MKMIAKPAGGFDVARTATGALQLEATLETAVIISLFTDRRAATDDVLPDAGQTLSPVPADRRGWAGDAFGGERIGSRLWLLDREKQTEEVRRRAEEYGYEALQWLIDDGHVLSVEISAEWAPEYQGRGRLNYHVRITQPGGAVFSTTANAGAVYGL